MCRQVLELLLRRWIIEQLLDVGTFFWFHSWKPDIQMKPFRMEHLKQKLPQRQSLTRCWCSAGFSVNGEGFLLCLTGSLLSWTMAENSSQELIWYQNWTLIKPCIPLSQCYTCTTHTFILLATPVEPYNSTRLMKQEHWVCRPPPRLSNPPSQWWGKNSSQRKEFLPNFRHLSPWPRPIFDKLFMQIRK